MTAPSVGDTTAPFHSTADYLIAYRNELLAGGVPEETTSEMVVSASRILIDKDGLGCHKP